VQREALVEGQAGGRLLQVLGVEAVAESEQKRQDAFLEHTDEDLSFRLESRLIATGIVTVR
jgi:hypothetical protein